MVLLHKNNRKISVILILPCCIFGFVFSKWHFPIDLLFRKHYPSRLVLLWTSVSILESVSQEDEIWRNSLRLFLGFLVQPSVFWENWLLLDFLPFPASFISSVLLSLCVGIFVKFLGLWSVYLNHFRKMRGELTQYEWSWIEPSGKSLQNCPLLDRKTDWGHMECAIVIHPNTQ